MGRDRSAAKKRKRFRTPLDRVYTGQDCFSAVRLILPALDRAVRLILPALDRERGSYGLKESALAAALVDALGLAKDSPDALRLINWRKGGARSGANTGTFALVVAEIQTRCCKTFAHVTTKRNKIKIVDAGALQPLIGFLRSTDSILHEHATAALLTLTAASITKAIIGAAGAIPLLVEILRDGSPQAKVDAVVALFNLSTIPKNINTILSARPIPPLIDLLKCCKKSSKIAEKCIALLETLLGDEEGRTALTSEEGGVLTVVEVLEEGSPLSREHAVGALLTMCESDRSRYREVILNEGAIPGLLELTVQGTPRSQSKARALLQLLRNSPYPRTEVEADTLENIVSNIVAHIDGDDRAGKAKKMLAEMVQVSMEQSLRHLQKRAFAAPTERSLGKCPSEVPSKW
ncbi:putative U-box domain-containing protein 4 [Cocos nucifera]|nr:putative U-box domain-containing protein 4 [Cocos nucifera]